MKISAIQNYSNRYCCKPKNITRKFDSEIPRDTVNFQGNKTAKGFGIGAIIGIGGLTLLTGGAAAPVAYALYAATMGTAGGMLGHAIDKTEEDKKANNNQQP